VCRRAASLRRRARRRGAERLRPQIYLYIYARRTTAPSRARSTRSLTAADFLLTHAAKPDRGNGLLRFVYGAAGYLAMTKLLPVIFAVPVAACGAPSLSSRQETVCFSRLGLSATLTRPTVPRRGRWRWTSRKPMGNAREARAETVCLTMYTPYYIAYIAR
jgi:hypothetical protein